MNRIVKIGWFIGGILIILLSYFSFQHKDENPPIESLSLEPFAQEIASEAESLFSQIIPKKSKPYSKAKTLPTPFKRLNWLIHWSTRKRTLRIF